jgi:hypothetical protein
LANAVQIKRKKINSTTNGTSFSWLNFCLTVLWTKAKSCRWSLKWKKGNGVWVSRDYFIRTLVQRTANGCVFSEHFDEGRSPREQFLSCFVVILRRSSFFLLLSI